MEGGCKPCRADSGIIVRLDGLLFFVGFACICLVLPVVWLLSIGAPLAFFPLAFLWLSPSELLQHSLGAPVSFAWGSLGALGMAWVSGDGVGVGRGFLDVYSCFFRVHRMCSSARSYVLRLCCTAWRATDFRAATASSV